MSDWTVFLLETRTGLVGSRLQEVASGAWSDGPLNGVPEGKVSVGRGLARVRAAGPEHPILRTLWQRGIMPWSDGVLICYQGVPVMAGPIVQLPAETTATVDLTFRGIEALLERWLVLAQNFPGGDELRRGENVRVEAGNLSWMAWLILKQSMERCGRLPIVPGMAEEPGSQNYRDYEPWNIENNGLWKRLAEVCGVENGPDVAFRPEWVPGEEGQRIRWRMMAGTTVSPYIQQTHEPVIDLGTPGIRVASIAPTGAWDPSTMVYGYGAGEGAGKLISFATAPEELRSHLPVLESVMADGGVDNWDLVQAHVDAEVAKLALPTTQISVVLPVDDPGLGVGAWWTGDQCQLVSDDSWLLLPAGQSSRRCIKRSGSLGASTYTVELQED